MIGMSIGALAWRSVVVVGNGAVVAGDGEWGGVETKRARGGSVTANECGGWSVGVCCACRTRGVIFGDDFCDCGIEVDEEVVLEVTRDTREFCILVLGVVNNLVKEGQQSASNTTKGLNNAGDN